MNYQREKGIVVFLHTVSLYGFIRSEKDDSVFFHSSGLTESEFKDLREGNIVDYIRVDSPRGDRAIDVKIAAR